MLSDVLKMKNRYVVKYFNNFFYLNHYVRIHEAGSYPKKQSFCKVVRQTSWELLEYYIILALPKFDLLLAAGLLVVPGGGAAQVVGRLAVHCTALPPRNRATIYIWEAGPMKFHRSPRLIILALQYRV